MPRIPAAMSWLCPSHPTGSLTAGDTVIAAIFALLALGPRGAFVTLALKEPSLAFTDLGTPGGDPCLAGLQKPQEGKERTEGPVLGA